MLMRTLMTMTGTAAILAASVAVAQEDRGQVQGGRDEQGRLTPDTTGPNDAEARTEKNKDVQKGTEPLSAEMVLHKLHKINKMEIKMGKLGAERGECAEVKQFGERLVADHQKADERVKQVAQQLNVEMKKDGEEKRHDKQMKKAADGPGDNVGDPGEKHDDKAEKHGEKMARLEALEGEEFDLAFSRKMHEGHVRAIAFAEKAQAELPEQEVKQLLAEVLPALREHERIAADLLRKHQGEDTPGLDGANTDN